MTAYKSLLKEKEALEASLSSVTKKKSENEPTSSENSASPTTSTQQSTIDNNAANSSEPNGNDQIQMQIATLMNSLATLSAEKSKMESSFQVCS